MKSRRTDRNGPKRLAMLRLWSNRTITNTPAAMVTNEHNTKSIPKGVDPSSVA